MENIDFAIVGAGAAGCILAARLCEKGANVVVIEAGAKETSPLLSVPAAETKWLGNPKYDWGYRTESDPTLYDRKLIIPRGRLVGGSNIINGTLFVRGQEDDYNRWQAAGAKGWDWKGVLPYFKKLEDWQGGANEVRGAGGPIRIERVRDTNKLCDAFIKGALELGYPKNADYNSGNVEGFGYYQCTQRAGKRVSVVDGYLKKIDPAKCKLITNATVSKLEFDDEKNCTGVSYVKDGKEHTISVNKEVIVSAGTIGSPQVLELSGIGNPEILKKAGVPVVHELEGVGENFQDHFSTRLRWRVLQRVTFNERLRGWPFIKECIKYIFKKRGVLSMPIAIGYGFVKSDPKEPVPDLQFHFAPASYGPEDKRRLEKEPGMTIGVYPLRPESRGAIHIKNDNPKSAPSITTQFLSSKEDIRRLLAGIRIAREIAHAPAFEKFRGKENIPGKEEVSEAQLIEQLKKTGDTSYHPIGTCKIGEDKSAVVNSRLQVHGVNNVRVIDASVMPEMISGNTQAATMMIAEKGAAMVVEDHFA
jgi:choline dehydrogenase-like flavoprotein